MGCNKLQGMVTVSSGYFLWTPSFADETNHNKLETARPAAPHLRICMDMFSCGLIRILKRCILLIPQHNNNVPGNKGIKRLQDLLLEDQSDSTTSLYLDQDSEENADKFDASLSNLLGVADTKTTITMSKASETPNITTLSDLEFWNCIDNEEDEPSWQSFQREYFQGCWAGNCYRIEQAEIVEKVISKLCFSKP